MSHRPLILAAALADDRALPDQGALLDRARTAEAAGLELVTIEPGPFDPLLVAAHLAARTSRIGVAPVVSTTTTEPFHVSTALATIDVVARGRGGWVVQVDDPAAVATTVTWDVPDDAAGDAAEHVAAVRALWDSWESGAEIRDVATARFIDRDRVHHVDLVGEHLSVRGPSITPRPPQGHPVVLARVDDATAGRLAEAGIDGVLGGPSATTALRFVDVAVGPDADERAGLADRLVALHASGIDGVVLHADDLAAVLAAVLPDLERAGLRAPGPVPGDPPTLRERLGLAPAVNRFEVRS
jgi:alkanesulfonate monooxygenase SsuD/methylene tetrahydromethanopterin reductase-like flavin-dependent oxidoreductase (luciferase family)